MFTLRRPAYTPTIKADPDTGAFSVDDPEPAAGPMTRNPVTGAMEPRQEAPETRIAGMLMSALREPAARPTGQPARVPAHLRRYLK